MNNIQRFILFILVFVLVAVLAGTSPSASRAQTPMSDALVLVNGASPAYSDFHELIQPYLDHFGVPYNVLDVSSTDVSADVVDYAVIIVGHRSLDPAGTYLDAAEQSHITAAVGSGTGLVNFDNDLVAVDGTPHYAFIQEIFGFGYGASASGSGVTFTAEGETGVRINLWEDAHQDPVLATTEDVNALLEDDGQWTEFLYTTGRDYPTILAGADEEVLGLPLMHFYTSGLANGEYEVLANLYTGSSGRDMRYYYGFTAGDPKAHYVDSVGGAGGADQHEEYSLGTVIVDDGTFDLYVQDADLLSGTYPFFGWAWLRLVPVDAPPPVMHYITERHTAGESISTGTMSISGIVLPTGTDVEAVATTGTQPFLAATTSQLGNAVQWGSYDWMEHAVKGPVYGLDDLVWRSIVWAARKPFVMQGLPPFLTMRVDDESGPFGWIEIANEYGFKPWAGLFYHNVDDSEAAHLSTLVNEGKATASVHAKSGTFFYYDHGSGDFSDEVVSANFAEATAWHQEHNIPISKFVLPHYYEFGTNVFQGLSDWGVEFVGTMMDPGTGYGSPWIVNGPFRLYTPRESSSASRPVYYADHLTVPGHPEFDGQFFNCVTEIRDDAGYEWYPDSNVEGTIGRGTRQTKRALDSMALATLFTHGYFLPSIPDASWDAILDGITANLASYDPIFVTMDEACQYVRAMDTSEILSSSYDTDARQLTVTLAGETDMATKFYLFTEADGTIRHELVDVPAFSGSTDVVYQFAGPLDHIVVTPATATVVTGGSQTFTAEGYDADGNVIPNLPFAWSVVNGGGTIDAQGTFAAGTTPGFYADTVVAAVEDVVGSASVEVVAPALDHFTFETVASPQHVGIPFPVTISAQDQSGNLLSGYEGPVALQDSTGTITPVTSGSFSGGRWTGEVVIGQAGTDVTITAADGGVSGTSNSFEVVAAPSYYAVTSPSYEQTAGEGFPVTVTAYQGTINVWEDGHQDPVLETFYDASLFVPDDDQWDEFKWDQRAYPGIFASQTESPPVMKFYGVVPNGTFRVIANLYRSNDFRYYYSFDPADPRARFVDVTTGPDGDFGEFDLGTVTVTDNVFALYTDHADVLLDRGAFPYYGWAWIRLLPVSGEVEIDAWDDAHQDPVLATTENVADLVEDDGQWTEFLYTPSRPYPTILAGADEEAVGLPVMKFYASSLANGVYEVYANLYTNVAGRDMRYYYGFTPDNPKAHYVDTVGGAGGTDQHEEYSLGTVEITDGSFNIYVQDADMLSGTYSFFGWAGIRLVPAGLAMSSNSATMRFDADADGVFGEPGDNIKPLVDGTFTISAQDTMAGAGVSIVAADNAGQSGSNSYTIVPATPQQVTVSPAETTVTVGESALYQATAADVYGNEWDVTPETVFSVEAGAGGAWVDNVYTSETAGDWTVTGAYAGLNGTALLHVESPAEPVCQVVQRDSFGSVADVFIWEAAPSMNFNKPKMMTGEKVHPKLGPGETQTLLRFGLDFLPAGAEIQSAEFGLVMPNNYAGSTVSVYRVTAPWSEREATWANFAGSYDPSQLWASFVADSTPITVDVTELVRLWADGSVTNEGMILVNADDQLLDQYMASEHPKLEKRPWLEVCYVAP